MTDGCFSCDNEAQFDVLPARENIAADEFWRVAHATNATLPGWLVLIPRRHVTAIADLTDDEAASLGTWQVRLSRALQTATGCVKTYVVQFAEAEGFAHVHFHIVARMSDLPKDQQGPNIFTLLGADETQRVAEDRMDALATALRLRLEKPGG